MKLKYIATVFLFGFLGEVSLVLGAGASLQGSPNMSEEDIKSLVVMIDSTLQGAPKIGAGIICGGGSDSLYIVTANHVVRTKSGNEAQAIEVQFKSQPGRRIKAELLRQRDPDLDLAVLRVSGLKELKINVEDLPFDRLGSLGSLRRGGGIYLLGYPGGRPWRINTTPERFAEAQGDSLEFESNLIAGGHSGGALLDKDYRLVGMLKSEEALHGQASKIDRIIQRLHEWGFPVDLGSQITPARFSAVSAGGSHACGLTPTGTMYCWGEIGTFDNTGGGLSIETDTPHRVLGGLTFQTVSVGEYHRCGLTMKGEAYCWGDNSRWQLGDGSDEKHEAPFPVAGGLRFKSVNAGPDYSCGVTTDGKGYCWGYTLGDRLGNGESSASMVPTPVFGGLAFRLVSTGGLSTYGVTMSGKAYRWGHESRVPISVFDNLTFETINRNCGLASDKTVYCWPDGTRVGESIVPVAVSRQIRFKSVSDDDRGNETCGITVGGAAYCWGSNGRGQLGNGSKEDSKIPVAVSGGLTFSSISVGTLFAVGVTTDGALYRWGRKLGEGARFDPGSTVPVHVPNAYLSTLRLSRIYRLERDYKKAFAEADAALKQYPNEPAVKRFHALVLSDLGKTTQAVSEMRTLLGGERDLRIHMDIAGIYQRAQDYVEMEKSLQLAEKLSKTEQEREVISFQRAEAYAFRMHKYEEAEAEFTKILKAQPESDRALNDLGYMLAERNVRLQEARELISRALKAEPQAAAYLDSMGLVCYRLGELDEAEKYLRRAWENGGSDPVIAEHLADVYFKKGNVVEAVARWRDALQECERSAPIDIDPAQVDRIRKKLEAAAKNPVK